MTLNDQEKRVALSLSGQGEWKLDETFSSSKYDIGHKFFQKNPHQRQLIKQFNIESALYDCGGEPVTSKNESQLSMSAANNGILFPPFQILNELFTAAANNHRQYILELLIFFS